MKIKNVQIKTWKGITILLGLFALVFGFYLKFSDFSELNQVHITNIDFSVLKLKNISRVLGAEDDPKPLPKPDMGILKKKGCIVDGVLSEYGGEKNTARVVKVINRSECQYLHRALETWLEPPDFELAQKIKDDIEREDLIYGMFIAEAIDTKADYYYPAKDRDFDFAKMCRSGSKNFWGEHTCKPSFASEEYRDYLRYITEKAMDMGIQSFLFGQIFYQDSNDLSQSFVPQIIKEMREYADFKNMDIVIGAQTNDITDPNYLKLFDYIEGGVGINGDGEIEGGPCLSRWWSKPGDWCWALLWNDKFSSKANNILVHLDWSGKFGDDMSIFARMDEKTRENTLKNLHKYFTSKNVGFLMPILTPLPEGNGGCFGRKEKYYSADSKYSCGDEDAINKILKKS